MKKLLTVLLLITFIISMFSLVALASTDDSHASKSKIAKEESSSGDKENAHETDDGNSSNEEGALEAESAWRFSGWQTIFAVFAVLYFVGISLNILPRIASREWEDNS